MRTLKIPNSLLMMVFSLLISCKEQVVSNKNKMIEKQLTFNAKTHALDNNDNFSPDGRYLCYDTRHMVFNSNLANSKSIEKVAIATGEETVLWKPESVSGENAAPGVAAVSYHPSENKVVFIHGPQLEEVDERGYYDIRNRNGAIVSADGTGDFSIADLRHVTTDGPTIAGAQRGGTHRHEYSRNGERIGFTYDDFLQQDYDRTIGYMEANKSAPEGFSHYFAVLLKPAKKGESKSGEIERAYGDSWVDSLGSKRAFIGKVRAENGADYETSLFVAEIPDSVDITSANSGDANTYPEPPKGIQIKRLTHSPSVEGIARGSYSGKQIAYLSKDKKGIFQVFVIPTNGSDLADDHEKRPKQVTNYLSDAAYVRWHPTDQWLFSISDGKVYASYVGGSTDFGKSILLTPDDLNREALVVSPDGKRLAYNVDLPDASTSRIIDGEQINEYKQIFIFELHDALKP
jgi:Tol biopolymer transport system component